MSPASKSKSKDKLAVRAAKEQQKPPLTFASTPASSGNGIPGSAYNPVSGTFHTLEMSPSSSTLPTSQSNGRFRTIDETEDHSGSSLGTTAELDSLSNNGSCSGESEDPKEKPTTAIVTLRTEPIPGSDTDKREKIRQKNEKKHQRQKERRAQELHERCTGYLMSRKLEALAQKLVSMGFSTERATMALIFNEGRVEESVMWLLEGGEEMKQEQGSTNLDGANLKIDIGDEVAKIAALEIKFKCTQTEVERAVVACEGDLDKAEDALKAQKQDHSSDHIACEFGGKLVPSPGGRIQVKVTAAPILAQQQRRDERDLSYNTKAAMAANVQSESPNRNHLLQPSRKILSKPLTTDWGRPQVAPPLDKRWPNVTASGPSVSSYPLASPPLHPVTPQPKPEPRYSIHEAKMTSSLQQQPVTLKEPIIMMQRPQSNGVKQQVGTSVGSLGASSSPPTSNGWYPNAAGIEAMKIAATSNGGLVQLRNGSHQFYPQQSYHHYQPPFGSSPSWSSGLRVGGGMASVRSSSLAVPSSLGLFTSWSSSGSSGSSSPVDWSTGGSMPQCDYTSIDWSLDLGSLTLPPSLKGDQLYGSSWSTSFMGSRASVPPDTADPSREWTSPFNGKDLFTAPRQFVTSPSLEGMM